MNGDTTMNDEMLHPHLTAKIVESYVRHHKLGSDQLADLITSVHRAIGQVGQPPEPDEVLTPAVSVRRSGARVGAIVSTVCRSPPTTSSALRGKRVDRGHHGTCVSSRAVTAPAAIAAVNPATIPALTLQL
jgi:hypothetical protein